MHARVPSREKASLVSVKRRVGPLLATHAVIASMDDTIELVARHCAKQINNFQRCILANQGNHAACDAYRRELSVCASESVPLLATVKKRCQTQLQAYDLCLKQGENDNDEQITSRCLGALRSLHNCTEAVRREETGNRDGLHGSTVGIKNAS